MGGSPRGRVGHNQAIVSDIGGVLTPPPVQAAAEFLSRHGMTIEEVTRAIRRHVERTQRNPLFELELGIIGEREFLAAVDEALGHEPGSGADLARFSDWYFATLEVNERLLGALGAARAAGAGLGLLSNNARDWHERWLATPGFEIFEVFVNSAVEGVRKPDPEIYRRALARLERPASACTFIDDLEVNCAAAREAGMRAIRFTTNDEVIPALEAVLGTALDQRERTGEAADQR